MRKKLGHSRRYILSLFAFPLFLTPLAGLSVRAQGGAQVTVLGQGPITGGTDHARANGQFVSILLRVTPLAGAAVFTVDGYSLADASGGVFGVTPNALIAMQDFNAGMKGSAIELQPGFPREIYLVFDVPRGAYVLQGPGINGQVPIAAR